MIFRRDFTPLLEDEELREIRRQNRASFLRIAVPLLLVGLVVTVPIIVTIVLVAQ